MATEKRLIDANGCPCIKCDRLGRCRPGLCEAVAEWWLSPVDAVEVVRCKDCKKWFRHTKVDRERGDCRRYQATKHETGFCDRGERKDNVL